MMLPNPVPKNPIKKNIFIITGGTIICMVVLLFMLPSLLLTDKFITSQFRLVLQKGLKDSGLVVEIGNVHWETWNGLLGTRVLLKERTSNQIIIQAEQIHLRFNPFILVTKMQNPEACLQKIILVKPQLTIERFSNNTWNLERYFKGQNRTLSLTGVLKLKDGQVLVRDWEYGDYLLQKVNGVINLEKYPAVNWSLSGNSNLGSRLRLNSHGRIRLDQQAGYGVITLKNGLLSRITRFIPPVFEYQVNSGFTDLQMQFALARGNFGIEKLKVTVRNADVLISSFPKTIRIKYLRGEVSPDMIRVTKGDLYYDQTEAHISGTMDLRKMRMHASIAANRILLEDWLPFLKLPPDLQIMGPVGLQLKIDGEIAAPRINGKINLDGINVIVQREQKIDGIHGRIVINNNNLNINRIEASWAKCPLEITGQINNILNPKLSIRVTARNFKLQNISPIRDLNLDIQTNYESDIHAEITGSVQYPELAATVMFKQLTYREIPVSNVMVKLVWNFTRNTLQIRNLSGYVWNGQLSVKGLVLFEPSGIRWQASGKVSSLDLSKISLGSTLPVQGKVSTNVVLRGNWKNGQPFKIGKVLGTFTGNRLIISDAIVDEADGVFSWNDGNLVIDSIQAKINQGRIFGYLSLDNQGQLTVNVNAENIQMRHLLPDAKKIPFDGMFRGSFAFKGPMNQLAGKIDGSFTGLTLNDKPIGDINGSLLYQNNQVVISNLLMTSDLGSFSMRGKISFGVESNVDINITGSNTNLNGLSQWLPIDPSIKIAGQGQIDLNITGNITNPQFHGLIFLTDPAFGIVKMKEGIIELNGNFMEMTLTKCRLQNNDSALDLTGKVNRERIDLTISAQSFDLSSLGLEAQGHRLQGLVDFNGELSGAITDPKLTANISGGKISFGPLSYQSLIANLSCDSRGLTIGKAELKQGDNTVTINGQVLFTKPIECKLEGTVTSFDINKLRQFFKIPVQLNLSGAISGTVKMNGPINNPILKITGDFKGSLNDSPLFGEIEMNYANNKIAIDKIELYQGNGAIIARGIWQNQRSLIAQVQLLNFPLKTVNQFINPSILLAGTINSNITLEWNTEKVAGECDAEITNLGVNENTLGNMQINGDFTDQGFRIKSTTLNGKSGIVNGSGFIPWPTGISSQFGLANINNQGPQQMEGNLTLKNLSVSLLNGYIPGFKVSGGSLDGNIQMNGELTRPIISGKIDMNNLKAAIEGLPLPVENLQAVLIITNNEIRIRRARGSYGTGNFTITGKASTQGFKNYEFDVNLTGSRIYYKSTFFDGFGDLNLKLNGTFDESLISGDISIFNAKVGVLGVSSAKNISSAWQPRFNIQIKTGNNTRCRVIGFADLVIKGSVTLKGNLNEPALDGEITSDNGVLTFYNNTFRIKKGKAVFRYSQGYNPYLELESSLKRAQTEIYLSAKGVAPDGVNISLSSRPFMPQANIFGLLNWTDLEAGQSINPQTIINRNISMVTDTIFGDFLYQLRQTLNISYLYLEPDQENDFRINLGSYLTQQLSYSYSRSIFNDDKKNWVFGLSYYFDPSWSLEYNYSPLDGTIWRLIYQIQL